MRPEEDALVLKWRLDFIADTDFLHARLSIHAYSAISEFPLFAGVDRGRAFQGKTLDSLGGCEPALLL